MISDAGIEPFKQVKSSIKSKFIKSTPGTWNIPATNGNYNVIIRSADSTGGSGGVYVIFGNSGTKGGFSKIDSVIIDSPKPGSSGRSYSLGDNSGKSQKGGDANSCSKGSFIAGADGQAGTGQTNGYFPGDGGTSGQCEYSGTITLSGEIEVVVGKNAGMPESRCYEGACGGLPGVPSNGYVEIIPID